MGNTSDMNENDILTGTCIDDEQNIVLSFTHNIDSGQYIELPNLNKADDVISVSINNNNEIVGVISNQSYRVAAYWELNNDTYEVTNLYEKVKEQIPFTPLFSEAVQIFDNGDIILFAYDEENTKSFIGYFKRSSTKEKEWTLKQSWSKRGIYFQNASADAQYIEISEWTIENDQLEITSYIYEKDTKAKDSGSIYTLKYNLRETLSTLGYPDIVITSCTGINHNKDMMCILVTENDFIYTVININTLEITDINKLFEEDMVEIPANYIFYPNIMGEDMNIYGQFTNEIDYMYVGRLVPVIEEPDIYLPIKEYIADKYSIDVNLIIFESNEYVEWSDSCFGVYRKDEMCLQVITPGYKLIFSYTGEDGKTRHFRIHTNLSLSYWREYTVPQKF